MVSFGAIAKCLPPGGAEWPRSSEICPRAAWWGGGWPPPFVRTSERKQQTTNFFRGSVTLFFTNYLITDRWMCIILWKRATHTLCYFTT